MADILKHANLVKSKDNALHVLNGAVLFSNSPQTKGTAVEKGALQCALDMADMIGHDIVVSYAHNPKNFWYGSYASREEAIALALSHPESKYFEIIRPKNARHMIADLEYVNGCILGPDDKMMKVAPDHVVQVLNNFICDLAEELSDVKVNREVEVSSSQGQAAAKNWKHVQKVSKHIKYAFGFEEHMPNRDFASAVTNRILQGNVPFLRYYDSKEKKAKSVFDNHPYNRNQAWRCLNSKKAEDNDPRRRLTADPGSSLNISDHLAVILNPNDPGVQILHLNIGNAGPQSRKAPGAAGVPPRMLQAKSPLSVSIKVPFTLLSSVMQNYSADRADGHGTWKRVLWAAFNVCYENDYIEEGRTIVKEFSARSSKYNEREVDVIWNTTQYRQDGLHWPSMRSWLWEDSRPSWRNLRRNPEYSDVMTQDKKHIYRELYTPHPERYSDVIKSVQNYKERYMLPYDMANYDVHIDCSPMDTRKTARFVDLVLSGEYNSVVIYVNRSTLCRAYVSRLNLEIRKAMGSYDETKMFRDYRRPDIVCDPLRENGTALDDEGDDSDFSNFDSSSEVDEDDSEERVISIDLQKFPFMVVQMESGYKLTGGPPDLLAGDEIESDLAQLSSSTMKKLKLCAEKFIYYVRSAGKVVLMDAFISDKTLGFVHNAFRGSEARVIYRHNSWIPENRKAFEIQAKDSRGLKSFMMAVIAAKVKAKKRVVLFSSNNKFAVAVSDKLHKMFPDTSVLLYNKYTDDLIKDAHFGDIDRVWCTADVVIYSPILLAGVSFNVADHFDCLFIFGYNMSCCVRDMWQASGRVRKFRDQELFYALDSFGQRPWNLPITYDGVRAAVVKHGEINKNYIAGTDIDANMSPGEYIDPLGDLLVTLEDDDFDAKDPANFGTIIQKAQKVSIIRKMEKAPAWLMDVHVRNIWEQYLTHNPASYKVVFQDFMRLAGWQRAGTLSKSDITRWENTIRREIGEKPKRVMIETPEVLRDYEKIEQITSKIANEITLRRNRGMATNIEKLQLERHWFDTEICKNPMCPQKVRCRVFALLDDRSQRKHLMNIWAESNRDAHQLADASTSSNPYPEMMDSMIPAILGVSKMLNLLGLQNSHDIETSVSEGVLETQQNSLQAIVDDLREILNFRPSASKSDKAIKVLKLNIDAVLGEFAGAKLVGKRRRSRIDGQASHYDYKLKKADGYLQDIIDLVCRVSENDISVEADAE